MDKRSVSAVIAYCSPAGATRHVARAIEAALGEFGIPCKTLDIGKEETRRSARSEVAALGPSACLFVGSPVYVNHAVPPVADFIADLASGADAAAVPFVTWGGASSGVALHEMGSALADKGFRLMGAAKVLGRHSMMWRSRSPIGDGRPGDEDDRQVQEMVATVIRRLTEAGSGGPVSLQDLDYQPAAIREELAAASLEKARAHMPQRTVHGDRCTECGLCVDACPTDAVELSPFPVFNDRCISCFNCVRVCPEDAISADLTKTEEMIRARAERFREAPETQIFL